MKEIIFIFLIGISSITNGQEINKDFLVTESSVGNFKKGINVKGLLKKINEEQIKKFVSYDNYENSYDDYKYFDLTNNHLLTFTPVVRNNENSIINRILIKDKRFTTIKKIGITSNYKDLKENYKTILYVPDMKHIVLKIQEINATFSISKDQLLENWWDQEKKEIDTTKIPDNATFDSFVIWWN